MRHRVYSDSPTAKVTFAEAYCPLCFAGAGAGATPELLDNMLHTLTNCRHIAAQVASLHQTASEALTADPLYMQHHHQWQAVVWNQIPEKLQMEILLGGPLRKSHWTSTSLSIKDWQRNFLERTVPVLWRVIQSKVHKSHQVPSGA